jgi:hypothetical protein
VLSTGALRAAARPTARASNLGLAAATVLLGAVPVTVAIAAGATSLTVPIIVLALSAGASVGWGGEDPSAEVLAPLPIPSTVRAAMRALFLVVVAGGGFGVVALGIALGPGLPADLRDRLPEASTAGAAALALALVLNRRGERGSGAAGVTAGLLVPLCIAALAFRWPTLLPAFMPGPVHHRWWAVAAVLAVVVARVGRDPGRR